MLLALPEVQALRALTTDGRLLFSTRIVRLFAYGFLSVVLVLYLAQLGLSEPQIRRMLLVGAGLMVLAGLLFALSRNILMLTVAGIIGTISPSGLEVGPSAALE